MPKAKQAPRVRVVGRLEKGEQGPLFRIRLAPALMTRLEQARQQNHRTLTGEIAHRLELSFRENDREEDRRATAAAAAGDAAKLFVVGEPLRAVLEGVATAAATQAVERYKAEAERLAATVAGHVLGFVSDEPDERGTVRLVKPYEPGEALEPLPGQIPGVQFKILGEEPGGIVVVSMQPEENRAEPSEKPAPAQPVGADLMGEPKPQADVPAQPGRRASTK
jgi:hypothetical protein